MSRNNIHKLEIASVLESRWDGITSLLLWNHCHQFGQVLLKQFVHVCQEFRLEVVELGEIVIAKDQFHLSQLGKVTQGHSPSVLVLDFLVDLFQSTDEVFLFVIFDAGAAEPSLVTALLFELTDDVRMHLE